MPEIIAATLRTLAFLTRLPAYGPAFRSRHPLGEDVAAFPLAGLVAALPSAAMLWLASACGLSPLTAAVLAVGLLVAVTGGLHEDGLGDVADGLGGHLPVARALVVMKDSRIGAYGALALMISLLLRVALLTELIAAGAGTAALALMLAAAASRGAMAWLWSSLPSADPGGLADREGRPTVRNGRMGAGLGVLLLLVVGGLALGPLAAVLALVLGVLALGQFRKLLIRRLGGQTGDALGACQQVTEIAMLLGFALAGGLTTG